MPPFFRPAFPEALQALEAVSELELHVQPYFMELPLLAEIFHALQANARFGDFEWLVFSRQHEVSKLSRPLHPERTVLIYIGNEDGFLPEWHVSVHRVFTPDLAQWPPPSGVCLIPLGPHGATPELPWQDWEERRLDVFFAGQVLKNRSRFLMQAIEMLYEFKAHPQYRAELHLSPHFQQGLSPQEFALRLMNTRLALVPNGLSPITLRLFEAMRSGCVLLTGQLPPFGYLQGLPRIEFPIHWQGLTETVLSLLREPERLRTLHQATRQHYLQTCTPTAIAAYIWQQLS